MNRKLGIYASVVIVLVMGAMAAWAWPQIPAVGSVAVHWSATGAPNVYVSKFWGLLGLPLLAAAVATLLALVPSFEPRARNLAMSGKAYVTIWIGGQAVIAVAYMALVLNATGHPLPINVAVPITVGTLFVLVGNYLGKTRSNFFFGVRTPWTLSSELSWAKTHRLAGRLFVLCGIVIMLTALVAPGPTTAMVIGMAIASVVVIPVLYSYLVWRTDPAKQPVGR
jgi:uncharacterized membrane protein